MQTWREQLQRNRDRWHKINKAAKHPHQSARERLIVERRYYEQPRRRGVRRIQHAIAERKKRRERIVRHHSREKIDRNRPSRPSSHAGPRLHHWPPEQNRGREKGRVFDLVPKLRAQRKLKS